MFDLSGSDDPFDDPFEDPFGDDRFDDGPLGGDGDGDDDLEEIFTASSRSTLLAFIAVLALVHVGLFSASLGLMLIWFRGQWLVGGVLVAGGVLAFVLALATYRRYRNRR